MIRICKFLYVIRLAGVLMLFCPVSFASNERIPTACEMEWEFRAAFQNESVTDASAWRQRELANSGDAQAQYFMGVAVQLDREQRIVWLKKAAANGSKGAAAYFSFYLDERWKAISDASWYRSAPM